MSFEKKIPSDDTLKNGLKDIADAIYNKDDVVLKANVNTGTFDPTSDNPASQKSIYNAIIPVTLEKLDQNLQNTISVHTSFIATNRADINKNTAEIKNLKESVNTGTFDPTSDNPAGQKSIAEVLVDKNTYYATAMIGRFAGGSFGPYENFDMFPDWSSYTNMSYIFAGVSIYGGDIPVVIDMGNINNTIPRGVNFTNAFSRTSFYSYWNQDADVDSKILFGNGRVEFHFSFVESNAKKILVKDGATCKIIGNCAYGFYRAKCNEIGAFDLSECDYLVGAFEDSSLLSLIHCKNFKISFNISSSTQFTESALVEIIGNLVDLTGKPSQTLTMGATNLAKLTDEEKAQATAKNWVLA